MVADVIGTFNDKPAATIVVAANACRHWRRRHPGDVRVISVLLEVAEIG
jgi:hypothetical protein